WARLPWPHCSRRAPSRPARSAAPTRSRRAARTTAPGRKASSSCSWRGGRGSWSCSTTNRGGRARRAGRCPRRPPARPPLRSRSGRLLPSRPPPGPGPAGRPAAGRRFARHGKCGAWVSELLPHLGTVVDDLAIVPTVATEVFNHGPAKLFVNTGTAQFGRPSMGAWITYGIGSESRDLPGFVVLQSGPRGPRGGAILWSSGFLPTAFQGVPFRTSGEPILNLTSPPGITSQRQNEA